VFVRQKSKQSPDSRGERATSLFKAGLGVKKIMFDLQDDVSDVKNKMSSEMLDGDDETIGFPKLKESGGYNE